MPPKEFEHFVASLLEEQGYDVVFTPQTRDGGYDMILKEYNELLGSNTYLVEVKKYPVDRKIGIGVVRALVGSVLSNNAQKGIVITNTDFTKGV